MTTSADDQTQMPYRAMRVAANLTLREVALRVTRKGVAMNHGRLSNIERGLVPNEDEREAIVQVLKEAL
jgi:hypothetical protein